MSIFCKFWNINLPRNFTFRCYLNENDINGRSFSTLRPSKCGSGQVVFEGKPFSRGWFKSSTFGNPKLFNHCNIMLSRKLRYLYKNKSGFLQILNSTFIILTFNDVVIHFFPNQLEFEIYQKSILEK